MAYAAHQARLSMPLPSGSSERDNLMGIVANKPSSSPEYKLAMTRLEGGVSLPDSLAYLFNWFLELRAAQRSDMNGLAPIGYTDLNDWAALTGREPAPWEIDIITALDRTVRAESAPKKEAPPMDVDVRRPGKRR